MYLKHDQDMKILFVGTGNADVLARQFRYYGVNAYVLAPPRWFSNPFNYNAFDVVYGVYLMDFCSSFPFVELFRKKYVIHIIGSDAFRYANARSEWERIRKKLWDLILNHSDEVLFVTKKLKETMGLDGGKIIPIPIDTEKFREQDYRGEKRDILYYCPDPKIYRLDWILNYAKERPSETITILGYKGTVDLPNVKVIPFVSYNKMSLLYAKHRRLIRMTLQDGYPKMPYEALLCGLDVVWNGQKITKVPSEMLMENTVPKLILILEQVLDKNRYSSA